MRPVLTLILSWVFLLSLPACRKKDKLATRLLILSSYPAAMCKWPAGKIPDTLTDGSVGATAFSIKVE